MSSGWEQQIAERVDQIMQPDADVEVWEWAEKNIVLTPLESSENYGPLNTSLTPFMREPLECYRHPVVRECTLVFGTQVVKTLIILVGTSWWVVHRAGRAGWVMDTENNARSFSKTRWQEVINASPALTSLKPANADDFGNLEQRLGASIVNFFGSNSPGNLASKPFDLLNEDEVEKYAQETLRESSALELAEQRTKSRAMAFTMRTSSPTIVSGDIWQAYLMGDQRKYFVPCPHCGQEITLEWEQVKWSQDARIKEHVWDLEAVRNTARYYCQECGGEINDGMKVRMLRDGSWRPTVEAPRWRRSYHLSSLYSPWASTTFGSLAVKYLDLKRKFDLKTWDNGYMAVPTHETAEKLNSDDLQDRREPLGLKPEGCLMAVAGGDTQDDRIEVEVVGFGSRFESYGLVHHVERGDPGSPDVWDRMEDFLLSMKRDAELRRVFWDIGGHHTDEVYSFCRRAKLRGWVLPCQGASQRTADILKNRRGSPQAKQQLRLFSVGTSRAKEWWAKASQAGPDEPRYCRFADSYSDEWFLQFAAEEARTRYVKGFPVIDWHKTRTRNEALDMRVYALAAMMQLGGQQYLARLERVAEQDKEEKKETAPARRPGRRGGFVNNW